ncbi:high mobility group B protein 10-like [Pyrus ussuriensis x Pyrus communis]|uniref:High mobility group B protein 10-like n=1 Tax=Pyrus ussuriensis x Pyrus communis TaxID=2448454 RepID=A0A5N5HEV0_9ROSA|nr:high mobility group B protein 10-like [Pyrus ussuriensis x Pyrus communis]
MARYNGGLKYGGESYAATPTHQSFINMTSPISLVKSNQVVLKLQSFHEEKIQAREKVDEFFLSCLRPTLKKFKRVHNKHHNDKQREASLLLDSTCIMGSAFFVSNVQKSNCTGHGYERVGSIKERFKPPDFSMSDGILIDFSIRFDVGFILDAKQMLIPAEVIKCEVSFDSSMIIDGEDVGNLGLHHLEACMDKNRKHERKFTLSKFRNGKSLDLHLLFVELASRGGLDKVIRDHKWKKVIVAFNIPTIITNASFVLRKYYLSLLYHFEQAYYLHEAVLTSQCLNL